MEKLHAREVIHRDDAIASCRPLPKPFKADDKDAVKECSALLTQAFNRRDAAGWAAQFAHDAIQMPPDAPRNVGRPAIYDWGKTLLDLFRVHLSTAAVELAVNEDRAYETGTFELDLVLEATGERMIRAGGYITIYRKTRDGRWLVARDIWNSNQPHRIAYHG